MNTRLHDLLKQLTFTGNKKLNVELRSIYYNKTNTLHTGDDSKDNYTMVFEFQFLLLDFIKLYSNNGIIDLDAKLSLNESLISAVLKGDVRSAKLLLGEGARLFDGPESQHISMFKWMFWRNNTDTRKDMLKLLIENGLDIDFKDKYGDNLLALLCRFSDKHDRNAPEIAKFLINYGVSFTETNNSGNTLLRKAVVAENISLVSLFIDYGADVNRFFDNGEFSLSIADNNLNLARFLVFKGARVDLKNYRGETALHEACFFKYEEKISFLIQKGADISAVDLFGKTPFRKLRYSEKASYDRCLITMVKVFSEMSFSEVPVYEDDMNLIRSNAKANDHFKNCLNELGEMSRTKFYGNFTYYAVFKMTKRIEKLARLTTNKNFVMSFKKNLSKFSYYESDLRRILNKAKRVKGKMKTVHSRLHFIFGNYLPNIVLTKLMYFLRIKDLPLN